MGQTGHYQFGITELGLSQHLEPVLQSVFGERFAERREEAHGGRKQDAVTLLTGRDAQGHGEMRFADAGRAEEQRILALLQIAPGAEFTDQFHINGGLDLKVERLQRLLEREPRHRQPHRQMLVGLGLHLAPQYLL